MNLALVSYTTNQSKAKYFDACWHNDSTLRLQTGHMGTVDPWTIATSYAHCPARTPVQHLQAIVVDIEPAEQDLPYETDISFFWPQLEFC